MDSFTELVDLHVHSNNSDGALSPAELLAKANQQDIRVLGMADHDSVAGIPEALAAAAIYGIEVIAAVELSVCYKEWNDIHLLGYGIDYRETKFLERLNRFREQRARRNLDILDRVNRKLTGEGKQEIPLQSVTTHARDSIGRPHIARALLERGLVMSVEDAFKRYLVPCNVPKLYWPIEDAIAEIQRVGGLAVLAHPTSIHSDREVLQELIGELQGHGLDGIEVYNNHAQPEEMEFLRRLALQWGLLITGGSDFHGIEDGIEMGRGRGGFHFSKSLLAPFLQRLSACQNQLLSL